MHNTIDFTNHDQPAGLQRNVETARVALAWGDLHQRSHSLMIRRDSTGRWWWCHSQGGFVSHSEAGPWATLRGLLSGAYMFTWHIGLCVLWLMGAVSHTLLPNPEIRNEKKRTARILQSGMLSYVALRHRNSKNPVMDSRGKWLTTRGIIVWRTYHLTWASGWPYSPNTQLRCWNWYSRRIDLHNAGKVYDLLFWGGSTSSRYMYVRKTIVE
jgi:hypothetical protein